MGLRETRLPLMPGSWLNLTAKGLHLPQRLDQLGLAQVFDWRRQGGAIDRRPPQPCPQGRDRKLLDRQRLVAAATAAPVGHHTQVPA